MLPENEKKTLTTVLGQSVSYNFQISDVVSSAGYTNPHDCGGYEMSVKSYIILNTATEELNSNAYSVSGSTLTI